MLGWSHRHAGALDAWRERIERELARSASQPDQRALWKVALGYAEEQRHADLAQGPPLGKPVTPWTIHRFRFLKEALEEAESSEVRLTVLVELARWFRSRHRPGQGAEFLAPHAVRLAPEHAARLEELLATLRNEEEARLRAEARLR
jgi:hypothetical protein